MPKKSSKPYGSIKRNNKTNTKLENTTRIRIDTERLNDFDSLDTSFLEGRLDRKVKNNKTFKEKIFKEKKFDISFDFTVLKNAISITIVSFLLILVVFLLLSNTLKGNDTPREGTKNKTVTVEKVVDDNYLLLGGFHTNKIDLDALGSFYVRSAGNGYTTQDVVDNMKSYVYDFNPSIVFIELGYNDLNDSVEDEYIITNISEIVDGIKKNRPYAEIYVESVYPVNDEDFEIEDKIKNDDIIDLNDMIKELTSSKKVNYLDVYKKLVKNGLLNKKYTNDGVHLNEEGYAKVLNMISKVVDEK